MPFYVPISCCFCFDCNKARDEKREKEAKQVRHVTIYYHFFVLNYVCFFFVCLFFSHIQKLCAFLSFILSVVKFFLASFYDGWSEMNATVLATLRFIFAFKLQLVRRRKEHIKAIWCPLFKKKNWNALITVPK